MRKIYVFTKRSSNIKLNNQESLFFFSGWLSTDEAYRKNPNPNPNKNSYYDNEKKEQERNDYDEYPIPYDVVEYYKGEKIKISENSKNLSNYDLLKQQKQINKKLGNEESVVSSFVHERITIPVTTNFFLTRGAEKIFTRGIKYMPWLLTKKSTGAVFSNETGNFILENNNWDYSENSWAKTAFEKVMVPGSTGTAIESIIKKTQVQKILN